MLQECMHARQCAGGRRREWGRAVKEQRDDCKLEGNKFDLAHHKVRHCGFEDAADDDDHHVRHDAVPQPDATPGQEVLHIHKRYPLLQRKRSTISQIHPCTNLLDRSCQAAHATSAFAGVLLDVETVHWRRSARLWGLHGQDSSTALCMVYMEIAADYEKREWQGRVAPRAMNRYLAHPRRWWSKGLAKRVAVTRRGMPQRSA